jgi:uncharacterized protein with GYD domain
MEAGGDRRTLVLTGTSRTPFWQHVAGVRVWRLVGGLIMARYVILINWTNQGVQAAKDTTQRAEQAIQVIEQMGGRMETLLWTLGRYDIVGIIEAPDDETAAAIGLRTAQPGAIRTELLRAFDAEEMGRILQQLG